MTYLDTYISYTKHNDKILCMSPFFVFGYIYISFFYQDLNYPSYFVLDACISTRHEYENELVNYSSYIREH